MVDEIDLMRWAITKNFNKTWLKWPCVWPVDADEHLICYTLGPIWNGGLHTVHCDDTGKMLVKNDGDSKVATHIINIIS
jgi:hypothetical protein